MPDVEPGNCTLEIPVNAKLADARFNATAVDPILTVELPKTPDGIVPVNVLAGVEEIVAVICVEPLVPKVIFPSTNVNAPVKPSNDVTPEIPVAPPPVALIVIEPVDPVIEIPVPAVILVTPVFATVNVFVGDSVIEIAVPATKLPE